MKHGSLFAGVDGLGMGFIRAGFETAFRVEWDAAAAGVLANHYPNDPLYCDVSKFDPDPEKFQIDVLDFGSPCQDLSVAGKRAGLDGQRSGLFHEGIRIAGILKPQFIVWENVPGALSSNSGADMECVIESFENLGYMVDIDIIDSQNFGVPQRRRRIFAVCQRIDHLLKSRSPESLAIISKCLCESLLLGMGALSNLSTPRLENSDWSKERCADGLRRRMRLLGSGSNDPASMSPLRNWVGDALRSAQEPKGSGLLTGGGISEPTPKATGSGVSPRNQESGFSDSNIDARWRIILGDLWDGGNASTTSTGIKRTTESKIYTYALGLQDIARLTAQWSDSSDTCLPSVLSVLTALKEFTNYARQASSDLFTGQEWIHHWIQFIREANEQTAFIICSGGDRLAEILFEPESVHGDHPPRRSEAEGVTGTLSARTQGGGGLGTDFDVAGGLIPEVICASTGQAGSEIGIGIGTTLNCNHEAPFIASVIPILEAGARTGASTDDPRAGIGIGEDGDPMFTLQATKQHAVAFAENSRAELRLEGGDGNVAGCLNTATDLNQNVIAFAQNQIGEVRTPDVMGTISTNSNASGRSTPMAAGAFGVRRLVPVEVERLQSWPDDWTRFKREVKLDGNRWIIGEAIKEQADGPRYKQAGNGVTTNVAEWIAKRIAATLKREGEDQ